MAFIGPRQHDIDSHKRFGNQHWAEVQKGISKFIDSFYDLETIPQGVVFALKAYILARRQVQQENKQIY